MTFVRRVERRHVLLVAVDDEHLALVVAHEAAAGVLRVLRAFGVDVRVRLVELVVTRRCAVDRGLHPRRAGRCRLRRRRRVLRHEERLRVGHVQHETQAGRVAGGFHRVDRLPRDVHERAARGDDGRLTFDLDPHLTFDHREPLARIGMEARRLPRARRATDVVRHQPAVVEESVGPRGLPGVAGLHVGELDPWHEAVAIPRRGRGLRCPHRRGHRPRTRHRRWRRVLSGGSGVDRDDEGGGQGDAHAAHHTPN